MFIGLGRYEFFLPTSVSLKDKRRVLRAVTMVVNKKFSVSIAEVDHQDLWQRAALGVACVSGSMDRCHQVLNEVERTMEKVAIDGAEIVDRQRHFIALEDL